MYIRCFECRGATWLEPVPPGSSVDLPCAGCGKSYRVRGSENLGTDALNQFRNALDLANRKRIDLPCAWSVLAGLMTMEQARSCRVDMGLERPDRALPSSARRAESVRDANSDNDAKASEGSPADELDEAQRAEVHRFARRHDLPLGIARRVVHQEITLAAARLLKPTFTESERKRAPAPRQPATSARKLPHQARIAAIAAAILLVPVLWWIWPRGAATTAERATVELPASTEIQRDGSGHPVQIVGTEPQDVLIAFCSQDPPDGCQPVKLALGSPPHAGERLGVFHKAGDGDALYAIRIRREGQARRWVAGDGEQPIRAVSPDLPPGSPEMPARSR